MRRMWMLVGVLAACAWTGWGQELIGNGSFTSAFSGWSKNGAGTLAAFASGRTDTNSCRHTGRTANNNGPYQVITNALNANGQGYYKASAWLYQGSGSAINGRFEIGVQTSGVWSWTNVTVSVPHNSWTLISGVPNLTWAGTLQAAWFIVNTESSTTTIYVDDCSLQRAVVDTPSMTPATGPFSDSVVVTVQCATASATIYYTTNNSDPTTSSPVYTGAFTLTETATVKAFAALSGWVSSATSTATFTKNGLPLVDTPTITPNGGSHVGQVEVSLGCTTDGASIYYTTNGTLPSTSSTLYEDPFTLFASATVKAIAAKSGMADSLTASANLTVATATPLISPAGGAFSGSVSVALTCATPGHTIYYSSDNSTPATNSQIYTMPFTLRGSTTVKAYAVSAGRADSAFTNVAFTTTPEPWASIALPGRLEAEDFAYGIDTVAYDDTTSGNAGRSYRTLTSNQQIDIFPLSDLSGYTIGLVAANEWMKYVVNTRRTGRYGFTLRVASGAAGTKTISLALDDTPIGTCSFTGNLGWNNYFDVTVPGIMLTSGVHTLKVTFDTAGTNLDYIDITPGAGTMILFL